MNKLNINQFEFDEVSKKNIYKAAIEAMLFVSGEPLSLRDIAVNLEVTPKFAEELLGEVMLDYEINNRGIKLILINGMYQLVTKGEYSEYIERLLNKNRRQSLSQASLESLSIIAYKQPITRVDIDEIRGVKSDSAIQRLIERELVAEVGRLEVIGRPILYGTTDEFLRQFGLSGLDELPSLDLFSVEDEKIEEENIFEDDILEDDILEDDE
ncbi:SMC-Scp complex subunit ScpB [Clostridium thermobutyricum]|uniref:Segregation and condensation protein B n=1 Tax=Clostridium thermobutyricum DSM 4928 TaxID=1121339 RepID=A0A1V4SSN3_9CLOT|nr:SMC-Scp complex subunit ScpB [Clostridium thermobutyricum]OPX46890.1 segregation and condensation protein B [Clostridium thermobutyricum DSM 4928]